MQVTALGLINSQGKTGDVPTNVNFALKGGAVSVSTVSYFLLLHVVPLIWKICKDEITISASA